MYRFPLFRLDLRRRTDVCCRCLLPPFMLHNLSAPAGHKLVRGLSWRRVMRYDDVLPTWIEPALLGHLVSEFAVGAQPPGKSGYSEDEGSENDGVDLPVRRLGVPATGWRPDVLGIAIESCQLREGAKSSGRRGSGSWELTELWDHHPVRALASDRQKVLSGL